MLFVVMCIQMIEVNTQILIAKLTNANEVSSETPPPFSTISTSFR